MTDDALACHSVALSASVRSCEGVVAVSRCPGFAFLFMISQRKPSAQSMSHFELAAEIFLVLDFA